MLGVKKHILSRGGKKRSVETNHPRFAGLFGLMFNLEPVILEGIVLVLIHDTPYAASYFRVNNVNI